MSRVYSPSTEALIAQLEDRMAEGRRFGVPAKRDSSAQDVRNWLDESDPETIEALKGLIQFYDITIGYRRKEYEERRRHILTWAAAVAILAILTGVWMALPNQFHAGIFGSAFLGAHAVAPLALMILLAVPYTRRGLMDGAGILLILLLCIFSLFSLFMFPMWWPTILGGTEVGILITVVVAGILILAAVGGWAYWTWHNPREGLGLAAYMAQFLVVAVAAEWVEKRYNINWWLTAGPAMGLLFLVNMIIERRQKRANNR